jgi:diguanylate cyclase (GGDEF)-like protein/PAS domain S-box-containing protein
MLVILGYLIGSGYREAINTIEATTRGYAAILEARLDATLRRADADVQQLIRTTPLAILNQDAVPRNPQIDGFLKTSLIEFPELAGVGIFDVRGDLLYTSGDRRIRPNIADRGHFRALSENPRADLAFSEVILARTTGRPGITLARPLRDAQGVFQGAVIALIELDHFQKLFQSLHVGTNGNVAIYRSDDFRQVLRWPAVTSKVNTPLSTDSPTRAALASGVKTVTVDLTSSTDGTPRIYSVHALQNYPFFVTVGISRDEALSGWRQHSLIAGLSTLLLLGLVLGLLARLWRANTDRAALAAIVDASNDAIVSRDVDGTVLSWNRGAEKLFGYSSTEMMGRDVAVLAPASLRGELRFGQENAPHFGARLHDSVRLNKNGAAIDVSIGAAPIRDAAGRVGSVALIFRDIGERKRSERAQAQLAAIVETSNDAIVGRAPDDTIISWNASAERLFGWRADEALGQPFRTLLSHTPGTAREQRFDKILQGESFPTPREDVRVRKDGSSAHLETTLSTVKDEHGKILFVSCIMRDISERIKAERHIERLATKDQLTGLSNRSMLMEQMQIAIARAARMQTHAVVMFVDLDQFKGVNDTLGHAAGDELLLECAQRLIDCVREEDVVARLGGDEFVVLLTDVADTAIVSPIGDRILKLLTEPYSLSGHHAQISASIGICIYPTDGNDVTTLMKNADIAMYHAKDQNRNNYQYYAEEMNQRMLQRAQLKSELRIAVENKEFVLHYQPQVAVATGKLQGVESLIRWQHPVRGLLSPAEFIAVAEETGLIVPIGEWVLNHACSMIKAWRARGVMIPHIVVNVSAAQLGEGLVTSVQQALVDHGIEAGWLMLEITETMLMKRVEESIAILRRVRALGVRIAMDDFGTGYSSLSVLQRLPLDTLKIDRSFVSAIDNDAGNARAVAIIGAIIAIAKELNLSVVAEGIETPTQLAFMRTLHCDTYQGYFFSKPLDTMMLEARFASPVTPPR